MAAEFEDRLRTAAERVRAEQQRAADDLARRVQERQVLVAKINRAIQDWNHRIVPLVGQAVARTNDVMSAAEIQITSSPDDVRVMRSNHVGPSIPPLPGLNIVRYAAPTQVPQQQPVRGVARTVVRAATHAQQRSEIARLQQMTRLRIGISENGDFFATPFNYKASVSVKRPVATPEIDEKTIGSLIAEFVDAGLLGHHEETNLASAVSDLSGDELSTSAFNATPFGNNQFSQHGTSTFDTASNQIPTLKGEVSNAIRLASGGTELVIPPNGQASPTPPNPLEPTTRSPVEPTIAAQRILANRLSERPTDIGAAARALCKAIADQIDQLNASKPNEAEALNKQNDFVTFLKEIASGLTALADTLDQAVAAAREGAAEPMLLGTAGKIAEQLSVTVKEGLERHRAYLADCAIRFSVFAAGFVFLNACGVDGHIAGAVAALMNLKLPKAGTSTK